MNIAMEQTEVSGHDCSTAYVKAPGRCANKRAVDGAAVRAADARQLEAPTHPCMALHASQEFVNGQLKNKYGDAFIRGNNGETTCSTPMSHCRSCLQYSGRSGVEGSPSVHDSHIEQHATLQTQTCVPSLCNAAVLYISTVKQ